MTTYAVTIEFAKPPAFGCTVKADSVLLAKIKAVKIAEASGFTDPVHRITAKKLEPNA